MNVLSTDPSSTVLHISEITESIFRPGKKEETILLMRPVINGNIYYILRMNKKVQKFIHMRYIPIYIYTHTSANICVYT